MFMELPRDSTEVVLRDAPKLLSAEEVGLALLTEE